MRRYSKASAACSHFDQTNNSQHGLVVCMINKRGPRVRKDDLQLTICKSSKSSRGRNFARSSRPPRSRLDTSPAFAEYRPSDVLIEQKRGVVKESEKRQKKIPILRIFRLLLCLLSFTSAQLLSFVGLLSFESTGVKSRMSAVHRGRIDAQMKREGKSPKCEVHKQRNLAASTSFADRAERKAALISRGKPFA
jgi:hypothetical protein